MKKQITWIKDNGLILLALILVVPFVWKYYKKEIQKSENIGVDNQIADLENNTELRKAEVKNTGVQLTKSYQITPKHHLHVIAQNIAEYLHVNYDWYDPRYYYEQDQDAYNEFQKFNKADMSIVKRLYNEVYAVGRNLQEDCLRFLDPTLYNKIRW